MYREKETIFSGRPVLRDPVASRVRHLGTMGLCSAPEARLFAVILGRERRLEEPIDGVFPG